MEEWKKKIRIPHTKMYFFTPTGALKLGKSTRAVFREFVFAQAYEKRNRRPGKISKSFTYVRVSKLGNYYLGDSDISRMQIHSNFINETFLHP